MQCRSQLILCYLILHSYGLLQGSVLFRVKNLPWESLVVKTSVQYCHARFLNLVCVLLEN